MEALLSEDGRLAAITAAYLIASSLFVMTLKGLSHPRTAVRANLLGALGMFIAIVATLFDRQVVTLEQALIGFVVGSLAGVWMAVKVQMTAMPQMVGVLNGFGGLASLLVGAAAMLDAIHIQQVFTAQFTIATVASALVGAVTFFGSIIAALKLQEVVVPSGAITATWLKVTNVVLALATLVLAGLVVASPTDLTWFWALVAASSLLGVTLIIPIGGADMPVVIALLNSYSGIAACATGFVFNNTMLIIAGALVGASGIILTQIMCKAMNRSLANVLFGGLGAVAATSKQDEYAVYAGKVTSASADEAAMILENARKVMIVPGYGVAVSQAQHAVRDLVNALTARHAEVSFAIHPVAGRMPGHMNVLLAEADIPYDQVLEMDTANPLFPETDVVLVIGANDVVNPLARTDPTSPIAGMPILDVDKARTVMVIKRSLSPGFAGIPNPLFAASNTMMLFGDGKKIVNDLVQSLKTSA